MYCFSLVWRQCGLPSKQASGRQRNRPVKRIDHGVSHHLDQTARLGARTSGTCAGIFPKRRGCVVAQAVRTRFGRQASASDGCQYPTVSDCDSGAPPMERPIRVYLAPDDNLNAASDSDIFYYYGFPLRRDANADAKSGVGFIMWGGGEYQHPLGERLWLHAGANIAQREYPGIAFDQTTLAVHVGPRWLTDDTTELSLLGSARRGWVAGETTIVNTAFALRSSAISLRG